MDSTQLIFLIPIVAIIAGVTSDYLKQREKIRAKAATSQADLQRIKQLEDRVRVLERIVTDRGNALDREINALRD